MNKLMLGFRMNRLVQRGVAAAAAVLLVLGAALVPATAGAATTWTVGVGAESKDQGIQLAYYFPNDITVNVGDTVTFNWQTGEPHSVTFADSSSDTGVVAKPFTFSKTFGAPGDYNYFCELHTFMKGVVHVQAAGATYPHDQKYYDHQAEKQQDKLFAEGQRLRAQGLAAAAQDNSNHPSVTAGIGAAHPQDGGSIFILRFLMPNKHVKVGDTVTWTNRDPEAPHTITFNPADSPLVCLGLPPGLPPSLCPAGLDSPGHATISSLTPLVNSGFTWAAAPPFLPPPLQVGTVFKVTFTKAGTYQYYCDLHDTLGMVGTITVSQ